jgi:alkylated DNA repair protein alkB homolog 8
MDTIQIKIGSTVQNEEINKSVDTPGGLTVLNDFITCDEEDVLLKGIHWTDSGIKSDLKNRKVKHFGYEFLYGSNNIDVNNPLDEGVPSMCNFLWERLKERGIDVPSPPNQLTINQYSPGQGCSLIS